MTTRIVAPAEPGPYFEIHYDHHRAGVDAFAPARVYATSARARLGDNSIGWWVELEGVERVPGPGVEGWMWDAHGAALALLGRITGAPWAWLS